ncbi:hypothetical protein NQZ79_g7009 [Umbelopsis isabellina]|nr:hypothetical protein NQZ79_g7009 [Umbelopsis isabellina]
MELYLADCESLCKHGHFSNDNGYSRNVQVHVGILPTVPMLITDCFLSFDLQTILGVLFDKEVEALTESVNDPDDPHAVAQACFSAAIVYGCFLAFCGCQLAIDLSLHFGSWQKLLSFHFLSVIDDMLFEEHHNYHGPRSNATGK